MICSGELFSWVLHSLFYVGQNKSICTFLLARTITENVNINIFSKRKMRDYQQLSSIRDSACVCNRSATSTATKIFKQKKKQDEILWQRPLPTDPAATNTTSFK